MVRYRHYNDQKVFTAEVGREWTIAGPSTTFTSKVVGGWRLATSIQVSKSDLLLGRRSFLWSDSG